MSFVTNSYRFQLTRLHNNLDFFKIRRGLWLSANFKSIYSCTTFIDVYFNYLCDMKYETLKWLFLFWWDKILDTTNFISPSPYKKIIYRNKTTQVFRKTDSKKNKKRKTLFIFTQNMIVSRHFCILHVYASNTLTLMSIRYNIWDRRHIRIMGKLKATMVRKMCKRNRNRYLLWTCVWSLFQTSLRDNQLEKFKFLKMV